MLISLSNSNVKRTQNLLVNEIAVWVDDVGKQGLIWGEALMAGSNGIARR
jgi:hypothetical protein